jgi:hypothetical protein
MAMGQFRLASRALPPLRTTRAPAALKLTGYPPLKPNIIFCDYLLDHNLSLRMDHQFKEDRKAVSTLKNSSISPRTNIPGTYLIFITSLPEDEQTSKHGGGGRYDANLEFKGEQINFF